MIEFEKFEQELETDEGGMEMEKPRMRRKRNIEGMIEKLKRLQRALKESQKMYFAEQGKVVLRWYQDYKQNKATVRELENALKKVAELFGKDLNEVIE